MRILPVGTDRYAFATVSVAGTSNVSGDPLILHTINITDVTDGETLTVCNGTTSGAATVAVIDSGTMGTYRFDAQLGSGLKLVSSGAVKACVTYSTI